MLVQPTPAVTLHHQKYLWRHPEGLRILLGHADILGHDVAAAALKLKGCYDKGVLPCDANARKAPRGFKRKPAER